MLRTAIRTTALVVALGLSSSALAGKHAIVGQVVDRNGQPVDRAIVSLEPGNVQLVTDREGRFLIDYLRDETGERTKLAKKSDYTLEIFKAGYHIETRAFFFKRGTVEVDRVTLVRDTIEMADDTSGMDPADFDQATHSAGANYEGQ